MKPRNKKDYYKLLEVPQDAAKAEIDSAYRDLLDMYGFDSPATYSLYDEEQRADILREIQEAYDILSDKVRRKHYDENILVLSDYKTSSDKESNDKEQLLKSKQSEDLLDEKVDRAKEEVADLFQGAEEIPRGPFLKRLREKANLTMKELSLVTKLSQKAIDDLENDRFENMPARIYVQGFIKIYLKIFTSRYEELAKKYLTLYDEVMKLDKI